MPIKGRRTFREDSGGAGGFHGDLNHRDISGRMIQWIFVFYITPDIRRNAAEGDSGEKQQLDWCVFKHTVTAGWLQKQLYYWFRYCTLLYRKKPQESRKQGVSGKEGRFLVCFKTHLRIPAGKVR